MATAADIGEYGTTLAVLRAHGDNPSAFLALNEGNRHFSTPGIDGVIAYRAAGRYLLQFGGPFATSGDRPELLRRFVDHAAGQRRRVVALQLQAADAMLYAGHGFAVNQLGASYALDLSTFTLRGSRFMRLRNKISRAERSGLRVVETTPAAYADQIAAIDRQWLRSKGWHVKELDFLIGQLGGRAQEHRRLFVGLLGEEPVAYISYSPAFGSRPGWLHDLSRRRPGVPPGVMEAINVHAITAFQESGAAWLHFGFTPFTALDRDLATPTASPTVERFVRFLATHGDKVYPARTQVAYKEKWGPRVVLPEYLAFHGRPSPGAIWTVLRVTRSI
ncbi:MAG: DUF2156 domain-containing protein [Actinobacteria bacterium]|nr:DUF2156 domain-containing protein [Actinomycetota bacterium]MBI3688537.1 DUF2156 domain-containing protein [Actinomycetota bacterium]